MLTVDQYDYIRTAHRVYGKTIRQNARDKGHSLNTVKKAQRSQFVGYPARARQPYPVLGPYLTTIDKWLKADKESPKKQRHTTRRIYHRLQFEHGYYQKKTLAAERTFSLVTVPLALTHQVQQRVVGAIRSRVDRGYFSISISRNRT